MSSDFTRGSIPRKLIAFSLPILAANLLQASMQLINGLWVGNLLGADAFAAVIIAMAVLHVVLAFVLGLNNAALTIFGQLRGANDGAGIDAALGAFALILGVLSLAIVAVGLLFADPLLALLNTPAAVLAPARSYLQVSLAGTLALVGYNFIGSLLRAFGDSRTPMYFVLLATVLAAGLVPLAIHGLGLGVTGAAWGMVLAQTAAFAWSLWHLARRSGPFAPRLRWPGWAQVRTVLELGIPSGVQMIVIYAGLTVLLSLVNTYGEGVVAGFGAAQRLDAIVLLPGLALGAAVNAMAAQNIGAGHWHRVSQVTRTGVACNLVAMTSISALLLLGAEPLVRLFLADPDSVAFGVSYLRTIAVFYPFIGLNFIFNGVVRGAGAMFQVLVLNIISLWLLRVPLAYLLADLYGAEGIALGIGLSFLLSSLVAAAYYRWGGWRRRALFDGAPAPARG